MIRAQVVVDEFRRWLGTTYRFGGEQDGCGPPRDIDCSEGVEWACRCAGIYIPDGSGNQFAHCDAAGLSIPFELAAVTVGALLFKSYSDSYPPGDRNAGGIYHVAMVSGPDTTMEICCDDGDPIVERSISGRSWYPWGALIPGVTYPAPTPPPSEDEDEDMPKLINAPDRPWYLLHGSGAMTMIPGGEDPDDVQAVWGALTTVGAGTLDALLATSAHILHDDEYGYEGLTV